MLSAYFEVKSSISNTGFAKAQTKKAKRKAGAARAKDVVVVVEAAEPDETSVRHARVREGNDDLCGLGDVVGGSSMTSDVTSSSLVRASAEDVIIMEDKWEYLWDDKAADDDNDDDLENEHESGGEEEPVVMMDALQDPTEDSDYGASLDQPSQLEVSPVIFRKSLERKMSTAAITEYQGPRLTLEDDDF